MELASEAEIEEKYCNTQEYGYESSEEQETRKAEEGNISIGTQEVRKPVEESQDLPIAAETVCDNNKRNKTQENFSKYLLDDLRISDSSDDGDFGSSSSDDYICVTDESSSSSDNERTSAKKKRTATSSVRYTSNITVPETPPSPMSTSENPVPGCFFWERNDTCSKCDRINMKLKYASVDQAANLKTLKEHQEAFKAAYGEKKADKQLAQSSEVVAVITFDLQQCLPTPKTNTANEKFLWLNVRSVLYNEESISCFSYKKEFKDVEYMTMDCSKRGKTYDNIFTIIMVPKAYHSKLPISTDKKKDVLNLLCFIHESAHEFYRSLSFKNDVKDSPAHNDNDSDGE
ncbi:unnamed protein product [Parnassius apollo]|uniref:(apollo) hypothetical protein n=1 Tax=Parnassius apollo TaxID=110799 RepID=A0A8S3XAK9_PARAO|nr:unnamed protein product [Parnassius apollo]